MESFQALVLERAPDKSDSAPNVGPRLASLGLSDLPVQGATLVRIHLSSLNYKDGLAVTGRGKIIRGEYPFVPGIDLVGEVIRCEDGVHDVGSMVIGTGWGIGEDCWGGFSQYQWIKSESLVPLPDGLSPRVAMTAGTAGLTAILAINEITARGREPHDGAIVVTGASGGVGSLAVLFLARMGFEVVASTGKTAEHDYLTELGASSIIHRDVLSAGATRPLDSARWSGAVDSVGGSTLEALLSQTRRHGVVASCGLAGGATFSSTVFPFILRGVALIGIDSNTCPNERRVDAWKQITQLLDEETAAKIGHVVPLSDVPAVSDAITRGRVRGRIVVDVNTGDNVGHNEDA